MSERNYDQGVADGIRSGNPALRELSKQIADLRSKLQTLERQRDEARVELRRVILSEPANAEGIASEGGSAEQAANPRELGTDAPSAEAGEPGVTPPAFEPPVRTANTSWEPSPTGSGAEDDWLGTREGYSYPAAHGWQTEDDLQPDWQTLARELAEALVVLEECVDDAWDGSEQAVITAGHVLARYHEAIAQHGGEGS